MKRVEVEWVDSNIAYGWQGMEAAKEKAVKRPLTCHSVGYLSGEYDDRINLIMSTADSTSGPESAAGEVLTIPSVAVVSIKELRIK